MSIILSVIPILFWIAMMLLLIVLSFTQYEKYKSEHFDKRDN